MTTNNGKVISVLVSSSGKATRNHGASNGRVIGDRARNKPGAIGIHADSNTLAIGVRCAGSSGAIDARVARTRGVSVLTDNALRRERTRRSTFSLMDVSGRAAKSHGALSD